MGKLNITTELVKVAFKDLAIGEIFIEPAIKTVSMKVGEAALVCLGNLENSPSVSLLGQFWTDVHPESTVIPVNATLNIPWEAVSFMRLDAK